MNKISIILKQLRNEKRYTQKQIAEDLKISPTGYAGYEQGIREPDIDMLIKISDYFEVSLDYLVGRKDY